MAQLPRHGASRTDLAKMRTSLGVNVRAFVLLGFRVYENSSLRNEVMGFEESRRDNRRTLLKVKSFREPPARFARPPICGRALGQSPRHGASRIKQTVRTNACDFGVALPRCASTSTDSMFVDQKKITKRAIMALDGRREPAGGKWYLVSLNSCKSQPNPTGRSKDIPVLML